MTKVPLAITIPYDPLYPITGKRKVHLSFDEEASYALAFVASCENGFGFFDAERVAWDLVQREHPRLRVFDAPERSLG